MSSSRELLIDAATGRRRPLLNQEPEFLSDADAWPSTSVEQHRLGEVEIAPGSPVNHLFAVHLEGVNELEVADDGGPFRLHRIGPGQVSLFPAGTIFASRTRNAGRFYTVSVTPQFFLNSTPSSDHAGLVEAIPQRGIHDAVVKALCDRIRDEVSAGHPNGRVYVETLAQALCAHVGRHYSRVATSPTASSGALAPHQLRKALEFIRSHLAEDLPLSNIARAAGLSPFHFARRFKLATGLAPHQFLIRQRVERARHLLGQSDIALADIAVQCGFCDQSHLTNHFRRLVGMTPRRYRHQIDA